MLVCESVNEAWVRTLNELFIKGRECAPRGRKVREIVNYSICVLNPLKRVVTNPFRQMSMAFACGELLWYLAGKDDLGTMLYYSRNFREFSDNGLTLNSAYGYRIFGHHHQLPFNQWAEAAKKLKMDPDTRQAIILLYTPNDQPTKDEVCTLSLQFLIRDGKLDLVVNMRSNDIVKGFTYDAFAFTVFQELMANELEIPVGRYFHNAASMHIYEQDYDMMRDVVKYLSELTYFTKWDIEMALDGLVLGSEELDCLMLAEEAFRGQNFGHCDCYEIYNGQLQNKFCKQVAKILYQFAVYRQYGREICFICPEDLGIEYDSVFDGMFYNYLASKEQPPALTIWEGCEAVGKSTAAAHFAKDTGHRLVHFTKPETGFPPLVYVNTILSREQLVLDRFVMSEMVYSRLFGRPPYVSALDYQMLLFMLAKRQQEALVILLHYNSLDVISKHFHLMSDDDKATFTVDDLALINKLYMDSVDQMADAGLNISCEAVDWSAVND